MAKRKAIESVIQPKVFENVEEIERAIAKLRRRIEDVESLDPQQHRYNGQDVKNVQAAIRKTILTIYGERSPEYRTHCGHIIHHGGLRLGDDEYDRHRKFAAGIPETKKMLDGLIKQLEEEREDFVPAKGEPEPEAQQEPQPSPTSPTFHIGKVENLSLGDIVHQRISVHAFFTTLADRVEASDITDDEQKKTLVARLREFARNPWVANIGSRTIFEAIKAAIVGSGPP